MRYFLDFRPEDSQILCLNDTKETAVNIWNFLSDSRNRSVETFVSYVRKEILPGLTSNDTVARHGGDLRNALRDLRNKGLILTAPDLVTVRDLLAGWISTLWENTFKHELRNLSHYTNSEMTKFEPGLHVRTGNVECRVIEQHLRNKKGNQEAIREISSKLGDAEFMYSDAGTEKLNWMDSGDQNWNIRKLITNAGFYPSIDEDGSTLNYWAEQYLEGLSNSRGMFRNPGVDFYENVIENLLLNARQSFNYINFPSRVRFHEMLQNQKVLFVTAFSLEIDEIYKNGKIFKLWKDYELPDFKLTTVQAPMSIYPNRPDDDWRNSFEKLCHAIDEQFAKQDFSLFFVSAGAYGIPMANYVHQKYGVSSNSFGNYTNFLFGVRQNTTESESPELRNWENWAKSSLSRISGLATVDDGRYVLTDRDSSRP